jgi:hypothetical protein
LVRQKENYNVEIRFANLFWGRPKYFGWFEHQALKKFKSTESLRKMQKFLNLKKDADDPAKKSTGLFRYPQKTGDNVDERVIADIIDVQIIEKK